MKILLIAPKFFDYEKHIIDELKRQGNNVTLIYENVYRYNYFHKFIKHFFNNSFHIFMERYFFNKFKKLNIDFDIVLCIRGEYLTKKNIVYLRNKLNKNCKFIYYLWDSSINVPNSLQICNYFDKVFSYSLIDSKKYRWIYKPLFYIDSLVNKENKKTIDILNISSLHSERAIIHFQIKKYAKKHGLIYKSYLYESLFAFLIKKYILKDALHKEITFSDISFFKIHLNKSYNMYSNAKSVIDYVEKAQTGLTIRSFEAISCQCKLITNNNLILQSDLYNPNNVLYYSNMDLNFDKDFINKRFIASDNIKKYSINNFVKEFFIDYV